MSSTIRLKKAHDIECLRISGSILGNVITFLTEEVHEGTLLVAIDEMARKKIKEHGALPAFLGYKPDWTDQKYPAAVCTSVNDQIVHGLPTHYALKSGDILKIDLGVNYRGYITDAAFTVGINEISDRAKKLLYATQRALESGIETCHPDNHIGDIGWAIECAVKKEGFRVIQGLTGHGVGFALHEEPTVWNYGRRGEGIKLEPGLVLAIEPMVSAGSDQIKESKDGSFKTKDGSLSAHFEKTILITETGHEILTPF